MIITVNFPIYAIGKKRPEKSGLQRDSNPWSPRYHCNALPTELWNHTLIYCDDHSSLSSTTAVQIWIISYILHNKYSVNKIEHVWIELRTRILEKLNKIWQANIWIGGVHVLPNHNMHNTLKLVMFSIEMLCHIVSLWTFKKSLLQSVYESVSGPLLFLTSPSHSSCAT